MDYVTMKVIIQWQFIWTLGLCYKQGHYSVTVQVNIRTRLQARSSLFSASWVEHLNYVTSKVIRVWKLSWTLELNYKQGHQSMKVELNGQTTLQARPQIRVCETFMVINNCWEGKETVHLNLSHLLIDRAERTILNIWLWMLYMWCSWITLE